MEKRESIFQVLQKEPKKWLSSKEIAEMMGITPRVAQNQLSKLGIG